MFIKSPIKKTEEVIPSIQAGADILYAGLKSQLIFKKGIVNNRRPWDVCNYSSLAELKKSAELVHEFNKKIYLTFNESNYTLAQIEAITDFIVENNYFDGFIVCDLNLIMALKEISNPVPVIGSVGLNVFNQMTAAFYKNFGIKEIVLPRHLKINEVKEIISSEPDMDFSYLIMNDDCFNVDGYCTYSHGIFDELACDNYKNIELYDFQNELLARKTNKFKKYNEYMRLPCLICYLWDLNQAGVQCFKIAGRGLPVSGIVQDIFLLKRVGSYLSYPRDKFMVKAQLEYQDIKKMKCNKYCLFKD